MSFLVFPIEFPTLMASLILARNRGAFGRTAPLGVKGHPVPSLLTSAQQGLRSADWSRVFLGLLYRKDMTYPSYVLYAGSGVLPQSKR